MRATLILEDNLVKEAQELTGTSEKASLVNAGLQALIAREAGIRLSNLGGSQPNLGKIPRRRPKR